MPDGFSWRRCNRAYLLLPAMLLQLLLWNKQSVCDASDANELIVVRSGRSRCLYYILAAIYAQLCSDAEFVSRVRLRESVGGSVKTIASASRLVAVAWRRRRIAFKEQYHLA